MITTTKKEYRVRITADTIIAESIGEYPETLKVYNKYNLRCPACGGSASDTIADIAWNHTVKLEDLLRDLDAVVDEVESK